MRYRKTKTGDIFVKRVCSRYSTVKLTLPVVFFLFFRLLAANALLHAASHSTAGVGGKNLHTTSRGTRHMADSVQIDHFIIGGQSNAVGRGDTTLSPKLTIAIGRQYWDGSIRVANNPIGQPIDSLHRGSAWPAFIIRYNQLTGHMVGLVQTAVGASSQVASTAPAAGGSWDTGGTLFNTMIARSDSSIAAFKAQGFHVNNCGMLWMQGEQDAIGVENGTTTGANYYQRAIIMINNFRAHYGPRVPFYMVRLGAASMRGHYGFDTIRNRQEQLAKAGYVIMIDRLASTFVQLGLMNPVPVFNNYHYSQPGYNLIGINAAENMVAGYKNVQVNVPANNAQLANIALSNGTLSPAFNPAQSNYSATVGSDTTTIIPPALDTSSIVTVNGKTVAWGAGLNNVKLMPGLNNFNIIVTAGDGVTTGSYHLTVNSTKSNNAGLSGLIISIGTIKPTFSTATAAYTVAVGNTITSLTLTPITADAGASVKINGTAAVSGTASGNIALNVGQNVIKTVITAADGVTTQTYTLTINRAASTNAKLSSLTTSCGGLTPAFSNTVTSYTRSVANTVTAINVTPMVADGSAIITVNGTTLASGATSGNIALAVGSNVINTLVTAQDGITKITYTITVNRAASSDATLSNLTIGPGMIKPAFNPDNTAYTVAAGNGLTSITLTPTTSNAGATVKIGGKVVTPGTASNPIPLAVGANNIALAITAQNGVTTRSYKITVTRAPSTNAKLLSLTTSNGALSPAFDNTITSYTRAVPNPVTSITFKPTVVNNTANITVNGTATASGVSSSPQPLVVGDNIENIKVTAQDGKTTITYTVKVTRAMAAANAFYEPVSVAQPLNTIELAGDDILVHQGLSPNGDGINDFLVIDDISKYPDNKLQIMNRAGQLIFEAKGYNNHIKVFDGHSSKTGVLQLPGTYFYSLEYVVNGIVKHKTGFMVLKY